MKMCHYRKALPLSSTSESNAALRCPVDLSPLHKRLFAEVRGRNTC